MSNRMCFAVLSAGIAVIAVIAMAASAAPAGAQGCCSLGLQPGNLTPTAGVQYGFAATGKNAFADEGAAYLQVYVIPTSATTCPAEYATAQQDASASGGAQVPGFFPENLDPYGNFAIPLAFTADQPGAWLFCGYTVEGTSTEAMGSMTLTFQANSSGGGGGNTGVGNTGGGGGGNAGGGGGSGAIKPTNTARPRVTRSGNQLRCTRGRWADSPTRFAYRWLVGGKAKAGATGSTLAITRRLRGHKVQCVVQASNSAGVTSSGSAPFSVH